MQIIGRIVLDLEVTKEKFERHQCVVSCDHVWLVCFRCMSFLLRLGLNSRPLTQDILAQIGCATQLPCVCDLLGSFDDCMNQLIFSFLFKVKHSCGLSNIIYSLKMCFCCKQFWIDGGYFHQILCCFLY